MTNMIDLDSFCKLSYYSNFETRSLDVSELLEGIFGPSPINPVKTKDSLIGENWPRFDIISDVNLTVNSPLLPCSLCSADVMPMGVIKLL